MRLQIHRVQNDAQWECVRRIRDEVFVVEQACPPEEEWDEHDATSRHFIGYLDGCPVATARWRTTAYRGERVAKLERFAVRESSRGQGLGRELIQFVIQDAESEGYAVLFLHAQAHLEPLYTDFGFESISEQFVEAGIPHVAMIRRGRSGSGASGG